MVELGKRSMICKLLSLDLSTSCTGYAVFDVKTQKLLEYGALKSSEKGISTKSYPERQLRKLIKMAEDIKEVIDRIDPDMILIEEVNPSKQRLGQKTLDGIHWILLLTIIDRIKTVKYKDSDGNSGWRSDIGLKLSPTDKLKNKQISEYNKQLKASRKKKKDIEGKLKDKINKKHLAVRWVNKKFNKNFDLDTDSTAGDICDAIGLGWAGLMNLSK
jgi:hypothetical protein